MRNTSDVLIAGYGWAGSLIAAQLVRLGLDVAVLERGADLHSPSCGHFHGPGQGRRPHERTQNAAAETFTLRHLDSGRALPIRRMGSFLSGSGVGGGGVLWGGISPRYAPESFTMPPAYRELIAADEELHGVAARDWPIGYDDLEPWYTQFEQIVGVAGAPGRTTARRSAPYPVRPAQATEAPEIFRQAAEGVGLDPSPLPMAEIAVPYTNPLGVTRCPCDVFGTTLATPLNTVDPYARGRLTLVTGAQVRRIEHDGKRVTGVRYVKDGREVVAVADRYVLAAWALNNIRLLLLSRIGTPYDPRADTGVVGRGLSNHLTFGAAGFYPGRVLDNSVQTSAGWVVSGYENQPAPGGERYVGGAQLHCSNLELKPKMDLLVPAGGRRWGREWKESLRRYGRSNIRVIVTGEVVAHRSRYADLDPVYTDAWGDPLLRLTYDWTANERRLARAIGGVARRILAASGAAPIEIRDTLSQRYDTAAYQNSHLAGGAVMGTSPRDSAVDPELRSWDLDNLWVVGSSSFPRNASPNPTPTVGALALRAAAAVTRTLPGAGLPRFPVSALSRCSQSSPEQTEGSSCVKAIIAGYTAAPADPRSRETYYTRLVSVPGADGLEFGWTAATPPDLAGTLDLLPPDWSVTLNDITATYQASVTSPRSGLASPDSEGRAAAVALASDLAAFVRGINDRQGRRAVAAVEIHSAPGFANRVLQPDQAAFAESLAEVAGLNWDGAEVLVEHCDAFVAGQPPAKGFLKIDQELAALAAVAGSGIGLSLNWGRSAIELRAADRVVEHVDSALRSGSLRAVTFSGASATPTAYGAAWADSHLPFADPGDPAYADPASLMTRGWVREVLDRLGQWDGAFVAVKTNWPPGRADPAERAASVAANFETVASLMSSRELEMPGR